MKALQLLTSFSLILCCAGLPVSAQDTHTKRPNVIILLSDDAGYNEFSFNGSKEIQTPRIDSIAKNGIHFTNGYVSGAVCSPSRAGLLTGRYQEHFGHEFNIPAGYSETNGLPLSESTLPDALKANGYQTFAVGKWHLGYAPKFHPVERGFTHFFGFLQGQRSYLPLEKASRLNQLLRDRDPVTPEQFTYLTDTLAAEASQYIRNSKDKPFFLYLAFNATHSPLQSTAEDLARAGGNKIKALTYSLDRAVGTVLDCLKETGLEKNTLVFFINDNGGATGHSNAPLRGHKGSSWEGGIRVPFAVQWPGTIPAGKTIDDPVIALDIFPTALAASGTVRKTEPPLDGVNLLPILKDPSTHLAQRPICWRHGPAWAIRCGDFKLTGGNKEQSAPALYNLKDDIAESKDLATSQPEEAKRLQALYDTWAAKIKPTPWGKGLKNPNEDDENGEETKPKKREAKTTPENR